MYGDFYLRGGEARNVHVFASSMCTVVVLGGTCAHGGTFGNCSLARGKSREYPPKPDKKSWEAWIKFYYPANPASHFYARCIGSLPLFNKVIPWNLRYCCLQVFNEFLSGIFQTCQICHLLAFFTKSLFIAVIVVVVVVVGCHWYVLWDNCCCCWSMLGVI